jgi:hypothetical protein
VGPPFFKEACGEAKRSLAHLLADMEFKGCLPLVATVMALPAAGHKTEVSGDIAGTWHLEPNHSPRAGEPARVWIALTQQGGQAIPLEQCDCQQLGRLQQGQEEQACPYF